MQLTRYENLTPNNIILKEAKEYKVKVRKSSIHALKLKPNIQMERKEL